jgi:TRAP transporter TAXI family solute receptor
VPMPHRPLSARTDLARRIERNKQTDPQEENSMASFPRMNSRVVSTVALALSLAAAPALAQQNKGQEVKLPKTIAWSAYDVGSAGYNQAVAIGNAFKDKYGVSLRVLPGKNDVSRNLVLREGKVQFSATGVGGAYLAQEGLFEFGDKQWGPQPVRALLLNNSDQSLSVVAAGDAGVEHIKDLKGKRVTWVIGSPSLNQNITALLACSGLTWDDVKKVEVGGFGASMDAILNNQADAAFASSVTGKVYQIASSPRGLSHPVVPHDDQECWQRIKSTAPFYKPVMATEGANMSKDKPVETVAYPYPILITYKDQKPDLVYNMTKAMVEAFPQYKEGAPGANGWNIERQEFGWVVPWHEGAIKYFKEAGVWTPEAQKHNDQLIKRQEVLAKAWQDLSKQRFADDQAFSKAWQAARSNALTQAGFEVVVTEW